MKTDLRRLVAEFAKRGKREDKGRAGELFATKWFERERLDYFHFPQTPDTMPATLRACGGKRPDFAVSIGEGKPLVYIDAKFHRTNNCTEFALEDAELRQFEQFRSWAQTEFKDDGERDVILMLYPQERNGDAFVWIHLDEMLNGMPCTIEGKAAKKVSLLDREGLWIDHVLSGN
jgi:hypothetical protein